jgi:5'-3' exonuclease
MKKLSEALFAYKLKHSPGCGYEIVVSDSEEPGEGETKIFNYIDDNQLKNEQITIYGLDADLIMLSMLIKRDNEIHLMREAEFYRHKLATDFLFLNIKLLKKEVLNYITSFNIQMNNKIEMYVVVCFLVGNDFVPSLSYLKIKNASIEFLLHAVSQVALENEELMYVNKFQKWEMNWILFTRLINYLSRFEDHEFAKNHNKYYSNSRKPKDEKDYYDTYGMYEKPVDTIKPNEDGWRHRYYKTLFPNTKVQNVCINYIQGLKWNIEYYFNKKCFTKWYYKYDYSPTVFDLNNYLIVNDVNEVTYCKDVDYIASSKHLLCILPMSSKHLFSEEQKQLLTEYKYLKYYPVDFRIQTYLKHYLHDCTPMLPNVMNILTGDNKGL